MNRANESSLAVPGLIDTHAHLDDHKFGVDRDAVLLRAAQAGVISIISVGADLVSSRAAVALSERSTTIWATVGVHPHDASSVDQSALDELRVLAAHPRVIAIGEIGLDYYRDLSPRPKQRDAFRTQLALAAELDKPIVVHVRDKRGEALAYGEALEVVSDWVLGSGCSQLPSTPGQPTTRRGVFHCFSGGLDVAQEALDLGFWIGIDGPVTYPNAQGLQTLVRELPLERLLLETDCPYLAPQAHRGKRNEPAYLTYIVRKVAGLKNVDVEEVVRVTRESAHTLFRLGSR